MRAALATIAIVVYLAGAWLTFVLVHGTDYAAQTSGSRAWLRTGMDLGLSLVWPLLLLWFLLSMLINIWWGVP